jgi:hypothetical protein
MIDELRGAETIERDTQRSAAICSVAMLNFFDLGFSVTEHSARIETKCEVGCDRTRALVRRIEQLVNLRVFRFLLRADTLRSNESTF